MTNVNYRVLSANIIKACKPVKGGSPIDFYVDYDKLHDLVADINLTPIKIGMVAKKLVPEQIPFLQEYFNKTHLEWLSDSKYVTTIAFIDSEYLDEKAIELMNKIATPQVDDPEDDKVKDFALLVTTYPCYFSTIVSYHNNSPKMSNKISYEIACRANKVVIKMSDYQYNHKDF